MDKIDLPESFYELPENQRKFLLKWIADNLRPIQTINKRHTSYGIRSWIEEEYKDVYYSNGEFKGAMLEAGYKTNDPDALNWYFNISELSPIIVKRKAQMK